MKLDIDGIQAFVQIAELGGFGKAASALHLTQTALTRRLQKLERTLGLRLVDRTTRSVALTAVGRRFLPRAQRIVTDLTESVAALRDLSRTGTGDFTIACVPSMAYQRLPSVLRAYARAHPGNRVRILDRSSVEVAAAVRSGEAEFGVNILLASHPDLAEELVLEDPFVVFCRKDHALTERTRVAWRALQAGDLITVSGRSGNRVLLDYQLAAARIDLRGRFEVEHLSTAIALVAAGVGAAILPASTLLAGAHPDIRRIPLIDPVIRRRIGMIRRRGAALSPAADAFHALLVEALSGGKVPPSAA